jgi:hypothetical protein
MPIATRGAIVVDRRRTTEETRMNMVNRSIMACLGSLAVVATLLLACSSPADAALVTPGFSTFEATPTTTVAGGHPNITLVTNVNAESFECTGSCLDYRVFKYHWPTGFIGNPHVAPKCSLTEFNEASCPVESQIGTTSVYFGEGEEGFMMPLFNMETRPNQAGQLGFLIPFLGSPTLLDLTSRTDGDYGLDAETSAILRGLGTKRITTELWGVPSDPVNDPRRFIQPLTQTGACYLGILGPEFIGCPPNTPFSSPTYATSNSPEAPFLTNPTTCGVPLTMSGDIEYYGGEVAHGESAYPPTTGCAQASFNPSLTGNPTTLQTDSASGLDTNLRVPQTQSPQTPSPSELRTATITLPEGFSINPNAVDGKVACPEGLSSVGTLFAANCPEFAKVGSLMLDVTALPAPIPGALYLAEPQPGEPYRVLLAADGFATHVKLLGKVDLDPQTGQVRVIFKDLPQSPLQEFSIHVFGSERGLLATPPHCGDYTLESEFVPWNSELTTRKSSSVFTIASGPGGGPCPNGARPFGPALSAGSASNSAGVDSPFSLALTRNDGDQNLAGVRVSTPKGFAATLKGVPYCPEPAIAQLNSTSYEGNTELVRPACPTASQVGVATTGVGAGTHPLYVPGKVYLAGPYKGAPLSLVVSVPAVSGPYDLGTVAVRVAVSVNPVTAQVSATSDPLPQILDGIPLRVRSVLVNLNRPDFAVNPTNCAEFDVGATLTGNEGGTASPSAHYQAANCSDLPYRPKMGLTLSGGVNRRGHPAIHADLTAVRGEANSRSVSVTLPKGELLDNSHIGTVCTRVDFAKNSCPSASLVGRVEVTTPLLDQPLAGNVYLRSSQHDLPDLALDLEGQINVEAIGMVDSVKGRLRTTFEDIPDVPISRISFDLAGGVKGLLQNTTSLCKGVKKATVRLAGQNGARRSIEVKLEAAAACGANARARSKRHAKHRHQTRKAVG